MADNVNHPAHYDRGLRFECIDIAEQGDYCTGNFIKYLWRYPYKGKPVEDLEKALWYAKRAKEQHTWPKIGDYPNAETIEALADTAKYGMEAELWRQLLTGAPWFWCIEYLENLLKEVKEHEAQNG